MNPFKNAQIIGVGIDPSTYIRQDAKRGDKDFIMSRSELMEFSLNPRRWLAGYNSEESDTRQTVWGSLIDTLVLEPEKFSSRFAVAPATYEVTAMECPQCHSVTDSKSCRNCKCDRFPVKQSKDWNWNAEYCDQWLKKQGTKTPIKESVHVDALKAVAAIRSDKSLADYIDCSQKQMMVMAEYHAVNGIVIPVKGLLDLVPDYNQPVCGESLADFKTSFTAAPAIWRKLVSKRNYDAQAAMFFDLYNAATGESRVEFRHIVQENVFPFEVMSPMAVLSSEFMEIGRTKYVSALIRYAACLESGKWPSYAPATRVIDGCQLIEPEPYAMNQQMESWPEIEEPTREPAGEPAHFEIIP